MYSSQVELYPCEVYKGASGSSDGSCLLPWGRFQQRDPRGFRDTRPIQPTFLLMYAPGACVHAALVPTNSARRRFVRVPQFKVGDRVRIVKSTGGFYGQVGSISSVQPSEELDRLEKQDSKFEILRSYSVKLDSGQAGFFAGIELEPE